MNNENAIPLVKKARYEENSSATGSPPRITSSPVPCKTAYEQKLGIQPKPKRPSTAFIKYTNDVVRPTLLKENPSIPITQVTKIASERWKNEDENVKKKLTEEYHGKMDIYRQAMVKYTEELSAVDKNLLVKHDLKIKKDRKELKKKRADLGCPKKPLSSYMLYLQHRRADKSDKSDSVPKDWLLKTAEDWNGLSLEEKERYNKAYEAEKVAYVQKMTAWEQDMRDSGNTSVLSSAAKHPRIKNPEPLK